MAISEQSILRNRGALWLAIALLGCSTLPGLAQQAAAPKRAHRHVLISIPHRQLVVLESGEIVARFPIAVGASANPSPSGQFVVANRLENPTYYHPGVVIPPGPENPIGPRWIGLDKKGFGIHGTNVPSSIGKAASHGCIRLRNLDIEKLFTLVAVGDTVEIRAENDSQLARLFGSPTNQQTVIAEAQPAPSAGGGH